MADFSVRSDSVDVEQIMRQIRARIRDKRGVDYTEEQIRELATAKLERFLDPSGIRSDLLEQFRSGLASEPPPMYQFEDTTLFESDKAIVRFVRRLLQPVLKLFFNYSVLSHTLHRQAAYNLRQQQREPVYFELIHNLVVELTRVSIDVKNLKMRVESLQSRLEFNERRARALEAVVQYKDVPAQGRDERQDRRADERRGRDRHEGQRDRQERQERPDRQDRPDRPERQDRQGPPRPLVPQAQPAPAAPAAPAPVAQVAAQAGEADPNTEPQGGVDPITGGESLRTRRRRRRRGRRGQGNVGAVAATTEGATDDAADAGGDDAGEIEAADTADATSATVRMERTEAVAPAPAPASEPLPTPEPARPPAPAYEPPPAPAPLAALEPARAPAPAYEPPPAPEPARAPASEARQDVDADVTTTERPASDRRQDGGPSEPGQQ